MTKPKPKSFRTDNGPEFLSKVFIYFCKDNDIELQYIQPGKPSQNAYIERLNRTFREDALDAYLFGSLSEVNAISYEWQIDYNINNPHKSLNGLSPWFIYEGIFDYLNLVIKFILCLKNGKATKTGKATAKAGKFPPFAQTYFIIFNTSQIVSSTALAKKMKESYDDAEIIKLSTRTPLKTFSDFGIVESKSTSTFEHIRKPQLTK